VPSDSVDIVSVPAMIYAPKTEIQT